MRQVAQVAFECAFDAVQAAEDVVVQRVELVGADDASQAGVDDGGGSAGLGDKAVGHVMLLRSSSG